MAMRSSALRSPAMVSSSEMRWLMTRKISDWRSGMLRARWLMAAKGSEQIALVSRATTLARCRPSWIASRPMISPGRWKPSTCSWPSWSMA